MILKTFNKVKELDSLEDLTQLSNAERLELFGFIYPNSMVKNYGKVNNNKSLTIGMIKLLSKVVEHQHNIITVIKELLPENVVFIENLVESPNGDDYIRGERLIDNQSDTIDKRIYRRDKEAISNDFNQSLAQSPMNDIYILLQKVLSEYSNRGMG